jgi:hypothetical protein
LARDRSGDVDRTVRRRIDVAKAFHDARTTEARSEVDAFLPAESVPELAVPRPEVPWDELDELSTRLLLRIDGATGTMDLIVDAEASPEQMTKALASLVERGLVCLVLRGDPFDEAPTGKIPNPGL